MVAQLTGGGGGGGINESGGEVRRVHIVYYLSRNGGIEHPHLIRIHQVSRKGVYLRDIKSWLSELRGEDMPERFAWSYKRMYKGGYVWQDLLDEDLITPICGNEYILKGSEISSRTLSNDINPYYEKEVFDLQKSPSSEMNAESPKYPSTEKEYPIVLSTDLDTSVEIEESSFASNVTTEDTTKNQDTLENEQVIQTPKDKNENNSLNKIAFFDRNTDDNNNSDNDKSKKRVNKCFKAPPILPTYSFGKSSRFSGSRASHMLRNWITCGTANTNEKAVVVIKQRKTSTVSSVSENNLGKICKEQKLRGYEKSFEGKNGSKKSKKEDSNNFKTSGAAYKPINGPNCSQCGRQFNPEKLHNHMKYCRGMKALAKSTSTRPRTKTSTPNSASFNTFYLTNN